MRMPGRTVLWALAIMALPILCGAGCSTNNLTFGSDDSTRRASSNGPGSNLKPMVRKTQAAPTGGGSATGAHAD
jgi:hypothetical protein